MLQLGQDPDEVDVAEAANQERDAEKYHAELQAHGQEDVQLSLREILITHLPLFVVSVRASWGIVAYGGIRSVLRADEGHDEHNAQVDEGENPEEDAGGDGIYRSPLQGVLDGESHAQVAFYADRSEEEGAVVDGHVEDEARQRAERVGHVPEHVVHHFLHLEGQEEEKEEVRDGQVEEQDVNGCGFLPHFRAESVEGEDIGREAQHKCNDVDGQTQPSVALLHGGLGVSKSVSQGSKRVTLCPRLWREWIHCNAGRGGGLICQAVRTAGDEGFLLGQRPGTNPVRQRGFPVPTDKPTLIVSSRALSSADKREWKEITTLHSTVFQPTVHLTLGLRVHRYTFYTLNFSPQAERRNQR